MSVVLESRMLRNFLHHLVDGLIDALENVAASLPPHASPRSPVRTGTLKPRITLEQKPRKPGRHPRGDVLIGCTKRGDQRQVLLTVSAAVVGRLGLGLKFPCDCQVSMVGRTLVLGPGRGARIRGTYAGQRHVLRLGGANRWGRPEAHRSEVCAWHFDLEDRLVIQVPAWLKQAPQKSKDDPLVSCKKMAGTNPAIKCHACKKATATIECNLCPTLLCNGCWEPHVRTHWHSKVTSRAPAGRAAAGK